MTVLARRSSLLLVFALACFAMLIALGAQQASAKTYNCHLSSSDKKPNKYGPSYLKRLGVKGGPTCAGGKNFVRLYYKCRTEGPKGPRGKCTHKVNGYKCTEHRTNVIPTSFDAKVTCSKGSRRVYHKYQQLTD